MGKVEKLSVSLTDEMLVEVQRAVASGDYASTSEVVREALSEWHHRRATEAGAVEDLRRLVAEADASGYEPYDGMASIKAAGKRRLSERGE